MPSFLRPESSLLLAFHSHSFHHTAISFLIMYFNPIHLHFYLLLIVVALSFSLNVYHQHPLQLDEASTSRRMILGIRGNRYSYGRIEVQDPSGDVQWKWRPSNIHKTSYLPDGVKSCITSGPSVTEVKWAANGTKILAVVGNAAIILNYAPDNPVLDQHIEFAICVHHTHTLELLPDDFVAVATTGKTPLDGIKIYDLNISKPMLDEPDPRPVQTIRDFPAVHGLLWDGISKKLWAVGNDKSPAGEEGPSQGLLRGYEFKPDFCRRNALDVEHVEESFVSDPKKLDVEWPKYDYWDGPHDLAGIPNTRKMLIATDLDVFGFDVDSQTFLNASEVDGYLKGFDPVSRPSSLPRSDIKCISINGNGEVMYVQSEWEEYFGTDVRILETDGGVKKIPISTSLYKARWFAEVPGWSAA